MGDGRYSTSKTVCSVTGKTEFARADFTRTAMYASNSRGETFSQRNINSAMNPYGVVARESRDSEEHPNSVPIIIALDVTGSMGSVPDFLVKKGFPDIMGQIIQKGIQDPQVLFLGIGDHECDEAPLQVGQFESSDELLDKWLTEVWLESGGGGNRGESYHLAWYFAAKHTELDSLDKRNKKGFLFTIGDEPVLGGLPADALKGIMGKGQYQNYTAEELFELAREKYHVFHVHVTHTASGSRQSVINEWKQIASDDLLIANRPEGVSGIIADTIIRIEAEQVDAPEDIVQEETQEVIQKIDPDDAPDEQEIML